MFFDCEKINEKYMIKSLEFCKGDINKLNMK